MSRLFPAADRAAAMSEGVRRDAGGRLASAGPGSCRPSPASIDLLTCRRLPSPRHGVLMIVNGRSRETEPLMRSGVVAANHLGAHLLSLSYSPYGVDGGGGAIEEAAMLRLLAVEGEQFEALSASVRGGRTWLPSQRPMLASMRALAWLADVVMLNADELAEGAGAWAHLRAIARTLGVPTLVRPVGVKAVGFDSVVVVSEASAASQDSIRRALPFILRARRVTILANDRSGDALKAGLLARGLNASSIDVQRSRSAHQALEVLRTETGHLVVHGGIFARFVSRPFGAFSRMRITEYQSVLLV